MPDERDALAQNWLSVAKWTLVSRVTGFLRVATIAAVLGPTYLGNTFQATNLIPSLTFELLTGSLLATLLVPTLVRHVDRCDHRAVERIAGGFLGLVAASFFAIGLLGVVAGPLIMQVLSSTVADPAVAADQRRVGLILLVMLMPQVVLYAVAGIGGAVMNAHGRFALAAAAPAAENIGVMATMLAVAMAFGTGNAISDVTTPELLVLGLGTTGAVGLHAAIQWWGARQIGVRLVPRLPRRDPEVRDIMRRALPSLGYAGLNGLRYFGVTVVANGVAGGVVAFSLALNFFFLPVMLAARPVAIALLPRMSRLHQSGAFTAFREELVRGLGLVAFLTIPAAVAYAGLAYPVARAVSFGELGSAHGITLLASALASLAAGVVGEGMFLMATHAAYGQGDARTPFYGMVVRMIVTVGGMVVALMFAEGAAVLVALGLALSLGNLVSAAYLIRSLVAGLPPSPVRLTSAVARALAGSAVMIGPAVLVAAAVGGPGSSRTLAILAIAGAIAVGGGVFVGAQRAWRSPELHFFLSMRRPGVVRAG